MPILGLMSSTYLESSGASLDSPIPARII